MIYNYYDFEENAPKDEFVEEEIKTLLEQIKSEKIIVTANMYNEKTLMDAEEREKEGRAINNLAFSEKRGTKYYTCLKFTRKEKIRTEIKKGNLCLLTINDEEINCEIHDITFNSVIVCTEDKIPKVSKNSTAKIDLILNETTFRRLEKNLLNLNETGKKH